MKQAPWRYIPGPTSPLLARWDIAFGGFEETVDRQIRRLEPANSRVTVILGLSGAFQMRSVFAPDSRASHDAFLVGLGSDPQVVEYFARQECIELTFPPTTAWHLVRGEAHAVARGIVSLQDALGRDAEFLFQHLREVRSWDRRFALLERFLLMRLRDQVLADHHPITYAWQQLRAHGGRLPIAQLAAEIGFSERHLENRFEERIGVAPKYAAQLIRFEAARVLIEDTSDLPLSEIALLAGYSDQSHFSREFRRFAGCTPAAYRRARFEDLLGKPADLLTA